MNYHDYLQQGGTPVLPTLDRRKNGTRLDVQCPRCNGFHHPAVVLDVSSLPVALTDGAQWVCDVCWIGWKRNKRDIDPGDNFVVPEEFEHKFFGLTGVATQAELDEYEQKWLVKALRQRRDDLDREIARGDAPASVHAERAAIQSRAGIPLSASTTTIAANGIATAEITGIPAGATVFVDGGEVVVTDGVLQLSANNPGAYTVRVTHPRKLPEQVTIHAN